MVSTPYSAARSTSEPDKMVSLALDGARSWFRYHHMFAELL